jgi:hypothetical protein
MECKCTVEEAIDEMNRRMNGKKPRTAAYFTRGRMVTRAIQAKAEAEAQLSRQEQANRRLSEEILDGIENAVYLRRGCATTSCNDDCSHCRANQRCTFQEPLPSVPTSVPNMFRPPPPTNATVVRVPIDLGRMTVSALQELIAAATNAINVK